MHPSLLLRAVEPGDLDRFFAQQRDPVARRMAAFSSADADDRAAFDARAAADNAGSIRALEKCGFVACGADRGFAPARGVEIDETLLRLDL